MIWVLVIEKQKKNPKTLRVKKRHLSSPFPRVTLDTSPPLLPLQATLSPFGEATSGSGGWGQVVVVSLCCPVFVALVLGSDVGH